jgi:hypothetical protein
MDRYNSHGSSNIDITTPKAYGDTSSPGMHAANTGNPVKHPSKNSKKRRRDDSDDEDDDDDADEDGEDDIPEGPALQEEVSREGTKG